MLAAIEGSGVNEIVSDWAEGTRFALDHLTSPAAASSPFLDAVDLSRVGVLGMSVGGAAAAEFCKSDARCGVGINIDGLHYGEHHSLPLNVPFLMLYSDDGVGVNDMLQLSATREYHEYHLVGSRHSDLTDLPTVWPIMKMYGQTGSVPVARAGAILNRVVRGFVDQHLKGVPLDLDPESLPELEMTVWPARSAATPACADAPSPS